MKSMPIPLIYELALNKAEAGDFAGATALFQDRFFGREEGGLNVRQVWIEVKLGKCKPWPKAVVAEKRSLKQRRLAGR